MPRDFEHVPTLEDLKETFGPGYYHVYTKIREEKTIGSKYIHIPPKVDENQVSISIPIFAFHTMNLLLFKKNQDY